MSGTDKSKMITAISVAIHAFIYDERDQHSYNRDVPLTPWQISAYSNHVRYHLQKPMSWSGRH